MLIKGICFGKIVFILLTAFILLFSGCDFFSGGGGEQEEQNNIPLNNDPPPITTFYTVTMQDDSNGKAMAVPNSASQGTKVEVSATPNVGFRFKNWQIISGTLTLSSATSSPANFSMPGHNVTIKAAFEPVPPDTPNLSLSPSTVTFSVIYEYALPAPQTITITNTGTMTANVASVALSGASPGLFNLANHGGITTIAENGGTESFTVQPSVGKGFGTHSDTITVSYDNGATALANVLIEVAKADPGVTWPTGLTATVGQTLSAITLPGNGTSVQAGNFSWTLGGTTPVGATGSRTHNMTFTPSDPNYSTLTQNVSVTVTGGSVPNNLTLGDPSTLVYTSPNYGSIKNLTPIDPASFTIAVSGFSSAIDASGVDLTIVNPAGLIAAVTDTSYSGGTMTYTFTVSFSNTTQTAITGPLNVSITGLSSVPPGYTNSGSPKTVPVTNIHDGLNSINQILVSKGNIRNFNIFLTDTSTRDTRLNRHYKLIENILQSDLRTDLGSAGNWRAIGAFSFHFTGSFDGGGHTISGLTINEPDLGFQGMFGYISGPDAVVKNIGLIGGSVTGNSPVGGIAGYVYGDSSNVTNCYSTGNISSNGYAGGIAGIVSGGSVNVTNCYSTGNISGSGGQIGGIVGGAYGDSVNVTNCYSTGNVSGFLNSVGGITGSIGGGSSNVTNCYSTGNVSGNWDVGGITGSVGGGSSNVTNCYSTGNISGSSQSGGIAGSVSGGSAYMKNSVALNPSITRTDGLGTTFGRVMGRVVNTTGPISGNYARNNMTAVGGFTFPAGQNTTSGLNGADVSTSAPNSGYNNQTFWQSTMGWDFSATGPWIWGSSNNLPALRNMP